MCTPRFAVAVALPGPLLLALTAAALAQDPVDPSSEADPESQPAPALDSDPGEPASPRSPKRFQAGIGTEEVDEGTPVDKYGDYSAANASAFGIDLSWNGYIRFGAEVVENPADVPFVGRNDGFKLANARVGLRARKGDFLAYISLEAAVGEGEGLNDPNQDFRVRLRDAFLRYDIGGIARISAGRFKTPYDLGELTATVRRAFIDLPVESRGVPATLGFEQRGLSTGRQLGLMIHRDQLGLSERGFDLGYAIAITNGDTGERALNDNDTPAVFARLSFLYGPWVQLNFGGFADRRTVGDLPDLFDEEDLGAEASIHAEIGGLILEAQLLVRTTSFPTSRRPDVFAYGWHGQISYDFGLIELGYRYAMLEPNTEDIQDFDQVYEHTAGAVLRLPDLPLALYVNGTLALEQAGRTLDNNRLAALAQFTF